MLRRLSRSTTSAAKASSIAANSNGTQCCSAIAATIPSPVALPVTAAAIDASHTTSSMMPLIDGRGVQKRCYSSNNHNASGRSGSSSSSRRRDRPLPSRRASADGGRERAPSPSSSVGNANSGSGTDNTNNSDRRGDSIKNSKPPHQHQHQGDRRSSQSHNQPRHKRHSNSGGGRRSDDDRQRRRNDGSDSRGASSSVNAVANNKNINSSGGDWTRELIKNSNRQPPTSSSNNSQKQHQHDRTSNNNHHKNSKQPPNSSGGNVASSSSPTFPPSSTSGDGKATATAASAMTTVNPLISICRSWRFSALSHITKENVGDRLKQSCCGHEDKFKLMPTQAEVVREIKLLRKQVDAHYAAVDEAAASAGGGKSNNKHQHPSTLSSSASSAQILTPKELAKKEGQLALSTLRACCLFSFPCAVLTSALKWLHKSHSKLSDEDTALALHDMYTLLPRIDEESSRATIEKYRQFRKSNRHNEQHHAAKEGAGGDSSSPSSSDDDDNMFFTNVHDLEAIPPFYDRSVFDNFRSVLTQQVDVCDHVRPLSRLAIAYRQFMAGKSEPSKRLVYQVTHDYRSGNYMLEMQKEQCPQRVFGIAVMVAVVCLWAPHFVSLPDSDNNRALFQMFDSARQRFVVDFDRATTATTSTNASSSSSAPSSSSASASGGKEKKAKQNGAADGSGSGGNSAPNNINHNDEFKEASFTLLLNESDLSKFFAAFGLTNRLALLQVRKVVITRQVLEGLANAFACEKQLAVLENKKNQKGEEEGAVGEEGERKDDSSYAKGILLPYPNCSALSLRGKALENTLCSLLSSHQTLTGRQRELIDEIICGNFHLFSDRLKLQVDIVIYDSASKFKSLASTVAEKILMLSEHVANLGETQQKLEHNDSSGSKAIESPSHAVSLCTEENVAALNEISPIKILCGFHNTPQFHSLVNAFGAKAIRECVEHQHSTLQDYCSLLSCFTSQATEYVKSKGNGEGCVPSAKRTSLATPIAKTAIPKVLKLSQERVSGSKIASLRNHDLMNYLCVLVHLFDVLPMVSEKSFASSPQQASSSADKKKKKSSAKESFNDGGSRNSNNTDDAAASLVQGDDDDEGSQQKALVVTSQPNSCDDNNAFIFDADTAQRLRVDIIQFVNEICSEIIARMPKPSLAMARFAIALRVPLRSSLRDDFVSWLVTLMQKPLSTISVLKELLLVIAGTSSPSSSSSSSSDALSSPSSTTGPATKNSNAEIINNIVLLSRIVSNVAKVSPTVEVGCHLFNDPDEGPRILTALQLAVRKYTQHTSVDPQFEQLLMGKFIKAFFETLNHFEQMQMSGKMTNSATLLIRENAVVDAHNNDDEHQSHDAEVASLSSAALKSSSSFPFALTPSTTPRRLHQHQRGAEPLFEPLFDFAFSTAPLDGFEGSDRIVMSTRHLFGSKFKRREVMAKPWVIEEVLTIILQSRCAIPLSAERFVDRTVQRCFAYSRSEVVEHMRRIALLKPFAEADTAARLFIQHFDEKHRQLRQKADGDDEAKKKQNETEENKDESQKEDSSTALTVKEDHQPATTDDDLRPIPFYHTYGESPSDDGRVGNEATAYLLAQFPSHLPKRLTSHFIAALKLSLITYVDLSPRNVDIILNASLPGGLPVLLLAIESARADVSQVLAKVTESPPHIRSLVLRVWGAAPARLLHQQQFLASAGIAAAANSSSSSNPNGGRAGRGSHSDASVSAILASETIEPVIAAQLNEVAQGVDVHGALQILKNHTVVIALPSLVIRTLWSTLVNGGGGDEKTTTDENANDAGSSSSSPSPFAEVQPETLLAIAIKLPELAPSITATLSSRSVSFVSLLCALNQRVPIEFIDVALRQINAKNNATAATAAADESKTPPSSGEEGNTIDGKSTTDSPSQPEKKKDDDLLIAKPPQHEVLTGHTNDSMATFGNATRLAAYFAKVYFMPSVQSAVVSSNISKYGAAATANKANANNPNFKGGGAKKRAAAAAAAAVAASKPQLFTHLPIETYDRLRALLIGASQIRVANNKQREQRMADLVEREMGRESNNKENAKTGGKSSPSPSSSPTISPITQQEVERCLNVCGQIYQLLRQRAKLAHDEAQNCYEVIRQEKVRIRLVQKKEAAAAAATAAAATKQEGDDESALTAAKKEGEAEEAEEAVSLAAVHEDEIERRLALIDQTRVDLIAIEETVATIKSILPTLVRLNTDSPAKLEKALSAIPPPLRPLAIEAVLGDAVLEKFKFINPLEDILDEDGKVIESEKTEEGDKEETKAEEAETTSATATTTEASEEEAVGAAASSSSASARTSKKPKPTKRTLPTTEGDCDDGTAPQQQPSSTVSPQQQQSLPRPRSMKFSTLFAFVQVLEKHAVYYEPFQTAMVAFVGQGLEVMSRVDNIRNPDGTLPPRVAEAVRGIGLTMGTDRQKVGGATATVKNNENGGGDDNSEVTNDKKDEGSSEIASAETDSATASPPVVIVVAAAGTPLDNAITLLKHALKGGTATDETIETLTKHLVAFSPTGMSRVEHLMRLLQCYADSPIVYPQHQHVVKALLSAEEAETEMSATDFSRVVSTMSRMKSLHMHRSSINHLLESIFSVADSHSQTVILKALAHDEQIITDNVQIMLECASRNIEYYTGDDIENVASGLIQMSNFVEFSQIEAFVEQLCSRTLTLINTAKKSTLVRMLQMLTHFKLQDVSVIEAIYASLEEKMPRLDTNQLLTILKSMVELEMPPREALILLVVKRLEGFVESMGPPHVVQTLSLLVDLNVAFLPATNGLFLRANDCKDLIRQQKSHQQMMERASEEYIIEAPPYVTRHFLKKQKERLRLQALLEIHLERKALMKETLALTNNAKQQKEGSSGEGESGGSGKTTSDAEKKNKSEDDDDDEEEEEEEEVEEDGEDDDDSDSPTVSTA